MFLESLCHDHSSFVTLTYSPENLPDGGTLVPKHAQDWLKRLRRAIHPAQVRFYLVGEYGDHTERPHYHAALFGLGVADLPVISRSWGHGHTHVAELNTSTAAYVAGYVVKKMTSISDPRLNGRHPEFARMSLKPGIGAPAMAVLARTYSENPHAAAELEVLGDVPNQLKMGRNSIPLARYLRARLRKEIGLTDDQTRAARDRLSHEASQEVCDLLSAALRTSPVATARSVTVERDTQKIRNVKSRYKIRGARTL